MAWRRARVSWNNLNRAITDNLRAQLGRAAALPASIIVAPTPYLTVHSMAMLSTRRSLEAQKLVLLAADFQTLISNSFFALLNTCASTGCKGGELAKLLIYAAVARVASPGFGSGSGSCSYPSETERVAYSSIFLVAAKLNLCS